MPEFEYVVEPMKAKEILAAQQRAGDALADAAERFVADHADPAPGEACFASAGLTQMSIAIRRWRSWTWEGTEE